MKQPELKLMLKGAAAIFRTAADELDLLREGKEDSKKLSQILHSVASAIAVVETFQKKKRKFIKTPMIKHNADADQNCSECFRFHPFRSCDE